MEIFDDTGISSFCTDYETDEKVKQEDRNGNYFNKVGPNKYVCGECGTYYIPYWCRYGMARAMFYKICAYHLFNGLKSNLLTGKNEYYINFAQYLPKVAPLCLDFDLVCKFTIEDRSKFKKGDDLHIYKQEHILNIVEILNNIIFDNFEVEKEEIKAYVFEKEEFKFKAKEEVKDGIHIIYLLPFNVKQRWFIRNELLNKLKEINFIDSFDFDIINDYKDIVDEAVIERNPWLTYGSIKVETKTAKDASGNTIYYTNNKGEKRKKMNYIKSKPYILSYIFDFDLYDENVDCMGNKLTYDTEEEIEELLNLFDLEQFSDDDPLEEKSDKLISFTYEEKVKKHKNNTQKSNNNNEKIDSNDKENYDEKIDYNYNITKEVLFEIVNVLKKNEDLYTSYMEWYKICCALYRNSKDCKIPDKDIKDAIYKFSSNSKSFNTEDFEDDYNNIIKGASKANYNYSLKYILDCINEINPKKASKIKKVVFSNLPKDNYLTNSYFFNNYKNNSLNIMDSSNSYFDEKKINNDQLSIIDYYDKLDNEYYEQHKDDEAKIKSIIINEPRINQGKTLDKMREEIKKMKKTSKSEIRALICHYLFKYVIFIQGEDIYFVYDFENKIYEPKPKRFLDNYILNDNLVFAYTDKNGELKTTAENPYKLYLNYIKYNCWYKINDINKPKLYEEIKIVDGKILGRRKIFNDGPIIPRYLTENYIPFNNYEQKYKDFVNGIFMLLRYSLCDNNEQDFEYLKNWVINKALFKRNRTIVVLQSTAQGVGKSTVAQLIKAMCEDKYVSVSNKCDWLFDKFNSILKDKILIGIEEMKRTESKSAWLGAYNRLKDLITNTSTVLEFKGKEAFEYVSQFDFIITSNIYNNLLLESENRRYFIPTVTTSKYSAVPSFKPVILEKHPISINENGKIKKIKEIKTIEQLCKYLNSIIINKNNTDIPLDQREKRKYFKCFYAYCYDNRNEEFDPSFIPVTNTVIQSNDKLMEFIYKYIKIRELYEKRHLTTDKKGNKIIKIVLNEIKEDLTYFIKILDYNDKNLERYNYCQHGIDIFKHDTHITPTNGLTTNQLVDHMKIKFGENYIENIKIKYKNSKCWTFIYPYDELLEYYKTKGYINNDEYEKLKGNYEKIDYCDNITSDFSYSSQIEELKQKIEEKDDLIKKYIEELKEKDRTFEGLKSFTNEQKDKEIEKLKSFNEDLDTKIKESEEIIKVKDKTIQENIDIVESKDKEIEELNVKIKELEEILSAKDNTITEDKEIEKSNDIVKENDNTNINKYREIINKDIKDITIQTLRSIANDCKIKLDKHIFKYKKQELYDLLKNYFNN